MSNQIAIKFNSVSFVLSKLKLGIQVPNSYHANNTSYSAIKFPPVPSSEGGVPVVGDIVFRDVDQNHVIQVSFKKIGEVPVPGRYGTVIFSNVDEDHTIEALFEYKPWPYLDRKTVLLLHFESQTYYNNSNQFSIPDSSSYNHVVSTFPNPSTIATLELDRYKKRWGKKSGRFLLHTGFNYYGIHVNDSMELGEFNVRNYDFTIDFWFLKYTPFGSVENLIFGLSSYTNILDPVTSVITDTVYHELLCYITDGIIRLGANINAPGTRMPAGNPDVWNTQNVILDNDWDGVANVWNHLAIVRYQGVWTMYLNGTAMANTSSVSVVFPVPTWATTIYFGPLAMEMDEFRFSNQVARWTENFIPPVGPYSDESLCELDLIFDLPALLNVVPEAIYKGDYIKLLAHMDGAEGSTTIVDSSIYQHPMTAVASAHLTSEANELTGTAGIFSLSSQVLGSTGLSVPASNDWNFGTEDFTIDFWVQMTFYNDRHGFFHLGSFPNEFYLELQNQPVGSFIAINTNGNSKASYFTVSMMNFFKHSDIWYYDIVTNRQWSHIAVVQKDQKTYLYVNGLMLENFDGGSYAELVYGDFQSLLYIGNARTSSFQGYMKNFRISKGIARWIGDFNPADITYTIDPYTRLFLPMSGTIGGTTFTDSGLGQYPVTNSGAVVIGNPDSSFGNSAIEFNGTTDYVIVPDSNDWYMGTHGFTIDFRVKFKAFQSGYHNPFFSQGVKGSTSYFGCDYSTAFGLPRIWLNLNNTILEFASGELALNTWIHIAIVGYEGQIKVYVNGYNNGQFLTGYTFNNIDSAFVIGTDGEFFLNAYVDEFRISHRAEWTSNFTPPTDPYTDPVIDVPDSYIEVSATFDLPASMEAEVRGPGEYDIEIEDSLSMDVTISNDLQLEYNAPIKMNIVRNNVQVHYDFVFSNRWKKELMGLYTDIQGVDGNYHTALMNHQFVFDPDIHEYFVDQADAFEIERHNGYQSDLPLAFAGFSEDGILSFDDFEFPSADSNSYGPVYSLLIYDYNTHERGLIVGCMNFENAFRVANSTIKLTDLSFQIV